MHNAHPTEPLASGDAVASAAPDAPEALASSPAATFKNRCFRALAHPKAPWVAGALIAIALGAGVLNVQGVPRLPGSQPDIVLFDPVRFANAQRAAASILAINPNADLSLTLTQVAKRAESVIQEEAHGALVLVKQTVVAPVGIPDITDAVLDRFGLPKEVPTLTTQPGDTPLEDLAPTDNAFSSGKLREDYRLELEARSQRLSQEQAKKSKQEQLLP